MRYHISRKGDPAPCDAPHGDCPLGGEHFDTPSEARNFVESSNEGRLFSPISNRNLPSVDDDIEANRKLFEKEGSQGLGSDMAGLYDSYFFEGTKDYEGLKGRRLAEKLSTKTNQTWSDPEDSTGDYHIKSDVTSKTFNGHTIYAVRHEITYSGRFNGVAYLAVRKDDDGDAIAHGDIVTNSPYLRGGALGHITDAEGWKNFKGETLERD